MNPFRVPFGSRRDKLRGHCRNAGAQRGNGRIEGLGAADSRGIADRPMHIVAAPHLLVRLSQTLIKKSPGARPGRVIGAWHPGPEKCGVGLPRRSPRDSRDRRGAFRRRQRECRCGPPRSPGRAANARNWRCRRRRHDPRPGWERPRAPRTPRESIAGRCGPVELGPHPPHDSPLVQHIGVERHEIRFHPEGRGDLARRHVADRQKVDDAQATAIPERRKSVDSALKVVHYAPRECAAPSVAANAFRSVTFERSRPVKVQVTGCDP